MAATTNYHKLNIKQQKLKTKQNRANKNSETYSLTVLESRSSKIKGSSGLVPSGSSEGESVPRLSPRFWRAAGHLGAPWLVDTSLQSGPLSLLLLLLWMSPPLLF